MVSKLMTAAASISFLVLSPAAFAQQYGTADEAKAMLMKAVAAVKADEAKALDMFNKGEGEFLDRDLYVFCSTISDGKLVADGNNNAKQLLGTDVRTLKTLRARRLARKSMRRTKSRKVNSPRSTICFQEPGADKTPVQKVSLVTRASNDLGCGVGYYK